MTRINLVVPKQLTDQHLVAEYREIKRVIPFALYRFEKEGKNGFNNLPKKYTLGEGHMSFFYNKLKFIINRFNWLKHEMIERGMNPNIEIDKEEIINENNSFLYNDWEPTEEDISLSRERIKQKIDEKISDNITNKTSYKYTYYSYPLDQIGYFEKVFK